MAIARGLDSLREAFYGGKLKQLVIGLGLAPYLRDAYWVFYRTVAGDEMTVRVAGASATFVTSTYSEYEMVAAVRGIERPVVRTTVTELAPTDVFWDVGANVGTFACLAGDVVREGTVVAFEPYPPNVERLEANLAANGVASVVKPLALSDAEGTVEFYVVDTDEPGTQQGSIRPEHVAADRAVETRSVRVATGDSLVDGGEVPPPDVVKIDVEGAGPEVLDGMANTLRRPRCRTVVVEPHDNFERVEGALRDAGFRIDDSHRKREDEPPTVVARDREAGPGPDADRA